ncbi:MAG TPA: ribosome biogenesis GTPase YlqF [Selenomonas sp.]|nr:ribosome biogenesis GTPase YlqF [Selenomonadaceae bacterium]HCB92299.1 ribosome biogenesis GTPase YlqF [Selenomonas sp.]
MTVNSPTQSLDIPKLQWFPGHMKKARQLIEENLKLVDVVIELLDARIPASSANPMLREILSDKPKLIALNKADLADPVSTKGWTEYFSARGIKTVAIDSVKGKGMKQLVSLAEELARPRTDKLVSKGANPRAARVMILGIPNVGKSSLINRLAGAARTKTEDRPGVTRAKQWIRIANKMELLDTPGILWPKFESPVAALRLAFTGAINDDIYDLEQVSCLLLEVLASQYPQLLAERFKYQQELPSAGIELLEIAGKKRGCLVRGGNVDYEKASRIVLSEFRSGKLGRITLDSVQEVEND